MFKEKIKKDLKEKIIEELNNASEELDIAIRFDEDDIIVYGSIFDKENPNDIDIFVKINIDLDKSNEEYQVYEFEEYESAYYDGEINAKNVIKDYLHGYIVGKEQPSYEGKKIDINVELFDFDEGQYHSYENGNYQNIEDFIYDMESLRIDKQKVALQNSEELNIFNSEEAKNKFGELANLQRSEPEIKMVQIQRYAGGGVITNMIEHIGDLSHRISQRVYIDTGAIEQSLNDIIPKINNALRRLNSSYPILKEFDENINNNFDYDKSYSDSKIKEKTPEEFKERVIKDLKEYARLHSELPVYNDVQKYARDAAVCLGNLDIEGLRSNLESLNNIIKQEIFVQEASKYDPDYEKNTLTNYLKSKINESKTEALVEKKKDDFKQELLKVIEKNKSVIDSMIPDEGLFSKNTYGAFENSDEDPNVYFQSDKWKDVIRENFFQARNSKNDTKAEFKSLMNQYLEDELKFFGHADLASKIITESIDLRKAFMNFKMSLSQVNEDALDPLMDIEDFREELLGELIDYIGNKDKTKPEDLYNNININFLIPFIENPNYIEDSKFVYSEDYDSILLTEENIAVMEELGISQNDIDRYYIQNRNIRIEDVNNRLRQDELLTYESLNKESKTNNMMLTKDFLDIIQKEKSVFPYVLVNKNINDLLEEDNDKIDLKNGIVCLHNEEQVTFFNKFEKNKEVRLQDIREQYFNLKEVPESVYQNIYDSYNKIKKSKKLKNDN